MKSNAFESCLLGDSASFRCDSIGLAVASIESFNAKVLFGLVKISIELFEDAVGIDEVIGAVFGKSPGLEFDRAGLRGSGGRVN